MQRRAFSTKTDNPFQRFNYDPNDGEKKLESIAGEVAKAQAQVRPPSGYEAFGESYPAHEERHGRAPAASYGVHPFGDRGRDLQSWPVGASGDPLPTQYLQPPQPLNGPFYQQSGDAFQYTQDIEGNLWDAGTQFATPPPQQRHRYQYQPVMHQPVMHEPAMHEHAMHQPAYPVSNDIMMHSQQGHRDGAFADQYSNYAEQYPNSSPFF